MSLISTLDLRTWMGIEEGDVLPNAKLDSISKAIQDFVDGFTNRKLEAAQYNSDPNFTYMDGTGARYLYLPQYPVSYIESVNIDSSRDFGGGTLIDIDDIFFYPESGKVVSEAGYFTQGRRNVKIDYKAGYAPVVGGTHNSAVSTYPIPRDLKQVMIEMCVESFKEGMTGVHTVQSVGIESQPKFVQLFGKRSFWTKTLSKYKSFDKQFQFRDE